MGHRTKQCFIRNLLDGSRFVIGLWVIPTDHQHELAEHVKRAIFANERLEVLNLLLNQPRNFSMELREMPLQFLELLDRPVPGVEFNKPAYLTWSGQTLT